MLQEPEQSPPATKKQRTSRAKKPKRSQEDEDTLKCVVQKLDGLRSYLEEKLDKN